jgi:hypothetical protein
MGFRIYCRGCDQYLAADRCTREAFYPTSLAAGEVLACPDCGEWVIWYDPMTGRAHEPVRGREGVWAEPSARS